jgi:hypothetical protein
MQIIPRRRLHAPFAPPLQALREQAPLGRSAAPHLNRTPPDQGQLWIIDLP